MSVNWIEQQRRLAANRCIWCASPSRYIENLGRYGVHCKRHARIICENYKRWKKRTGKR